MKPLEQNPTDTFLIGHKSSGLNTRPIPNSLGVEAATFSDKVHSLLRNKGIRDFWLMGDSGGKNHSSGNLVDGAPTQDANHQVTARVSSLDKRV